MKEGKTHQKRKVPCVWNLTLYKQCDLRIPTWPSAPRCFCNRSRLSQQEPDPARFISGEETRCIPSNNGTLFKHPRRAEQPITRPPAGAPCDAPALRCASFLRIHTFCQSHWMCLCNRVMLFIWSHDVYCSVHPGEGSSSVALLKGSSPFPPPCGDIFSIFWEFSLIWCEVKGQGCRMCTDQGGKFTIFLGGNFCPYWLAIQGLLKRNWGHFLKLVK